MFSVRASKFISAIILATSSNLSMKNILRGITALLLFIFSACHKPSASLADETVAATISASRLFIIPKGEHSATDNPYKPVETRGIVFSVRFDSSAIYQTTDPQNQYDINKLWGFADNGAHHHRFSARIGWRWSDGALRLFGYTYNNGIRETAEIGPVAIGAEVACAISLVENGYLFKVNDKQLLMPRLSTTPVVKGYQLYPYFGGDEPAPHEVRIWIKEVSKD